MLRRCLLGFVVGSAAWSGIAKADLGRDVRALTSARSDRARVMRLKPRFLEQGDRLPLALPPELLDPKNASCTTVSLLGVVGTHFVLRFAETDPARPSTAYPEASAAGASEVTRCGSGKPFLASIFVEMRSPRGVLETIVSSSPGLLPRLTEVLPDRDPGAELALGDAGPRPALPPLNTRLLRLSARARREGAQQFEHSAVQAAPDGSGAETLPLGRGCHELTLLANSEPPVDLDMEMVDAESSARLGVDRAEDGDAALSVCLGAPTRVELRFIGGTPNAALSLLRARWDLPPGVPQAWAAEAQARLARVARAARLRLLSEPIYSSLGVQGSTELPFEVEPDACYSVLLVPVRGEARSLSLSVRAHVAGEMPRGSTDKDGSAISFCARGARRATVEVSGQGSNLAWLVSAWQSGRAPLGVTAR